MKIKILAAAILAVVAFNAHAVAVAGPDHVNASFEIESDVDYRTFDASLMPATFSVYNFLISDNHYDANFLGATCAGDCSAFSYDTVMHGFHNFVSLTTTTAGNYAATFRLSYIDDIEFNAQTTFVDARVLATVTPVPEPHTYALLIAGLGCMGFVAKRRGKRV